MTEPVNISNGTLLSPTSVMVSGSAFFAKVSADAERTIELTGDDNRNTDRANAIEFAARVRDKMVFVRGQGWRFYDGRRWVDDVDEVQAIQYLGELADELWLRARRQSDDERTRTRSRALALENSGGISGTLRFASAAPELVKEVSAFDKDPFLLNCPNGTFDLRTLTPVDRSPAHYITRMCPTPLELDAADDEVWTKALTEAMGHDADKLRFYQRWWGYCLTGSVKMKAFLAMVGTTNACKSTISEPFRYVLGDVDTGGYTSTWDAEMVQANAKVNRAEKLDKVRAARLILVGELEKGSRLADGFVKRYTGGNSMDAKALYKGSYSYSPQGKLLLDTNYVPKSSDSAVHDRLQMLYMDHVPERLDRSVKAHLETEIKAHKAMLRWAAEGARDWWADQRGSFGATPWLDDVKKKYVRGSDPLLRFVEECFDDCTDSPELSVHVKVAWALYQAWTAGYSERHMGYGNFGEAMEERGHVRARWPVKVGPTCFTGIKPKGVDQVEGGVLDALRACIMKGLVRV